MSARAPTERAEAWRPWRAYAVVHLWRDAPDRAQPEAGLARPPRASHTPRSSAALAQENPG